MAAKSTIVTPVRLSRTPARNQRIAMPNATTARWTGGSLPYNPPPIIKIGGATVKTSTSNRPVKNMMPKRPVKSMMPKQTTSSNQFKPAIPLTQKEVSQIGRAGIGIGLSILPLVLPRSKSKQTVISKDVIPVRLHTTSVPAITSSGGSSGSSGLSGIKVVSKARGDSVYTTQYFQNTKSAQQHIDSISRSGGIVSHVKED